MTDCTIRNMPDAVVERLSEVARLRDLSLDQAALEVIAHALGLDVEFEYYDLEDLDWVAEDEPPVATAVTTAARGACAATAPE